ncbi:MAG: ATP synthase F1 subunit gamma, partial [Flavobacteriales bacterium]
AITQMRPYANKLTELLVNLSSSLDSAEGGEFSSDRTINNVLLVPITSNRGLCGGFNANIIKQTTSLIREDFAAKNVSILSIGKKSSEYFKNNNYNVVSIHDEIYADLNYESVSNISESIMQDYLDLKYDKVILVYNQFKNAATQNVMREDYLPVQSPNDENASIGDYIFEPQKKEIIEQLIPKSLKTQLFKAVLDSHASEHGARMTAMHKATDNASELKKDLTLSYNKARQAAITAEILEIVGGAEALNN